MLNVFPMQLNILVKFRNHNDTQEAKTRQYGRGNLQVKQLQKTCNSEPTYHRHILVYKTGEKGWCCV